MYKDAIDTAAASGDEKLAESLLDFFVNIGNKPCFTATLYTCSSLVRPEVALELAWKNGLMDFAMPFMVQTMREMQTKLDGLVEKERKKEEAMSVKPKVPDAPSANDIPRTKLSDWLEKDVHAKVETRMKELAEERAESEVRSAAWIRR